MTTHLDPSPAAIPVAPALPASFHRVDLEAAGFIGWHSWDELRRSDFTAVPSSPAVYVIYRPCQEPRSFLPANPGGRFKGKDPSLPAATLDSNWIPGAHVVYIGKADVADRRLEQFARFGAGEPVGHWGGRLTWQLADSDELLVAWHPIIWDETARAYEKRLLAHFGSLCAGRRSFANLTG
jgi:hypothetical protein